MLRQRKIPLLLKWLYVLFMAIYLPVFLLGYGPQNFLWMSSAILILAFLATVLESRFLASMAAVGGLVFESLWTLDFLYTAIAFIIGTPVTSFTDYMFDPNLSIWLRFIALYHLTLPPLLIWLIFRLGYAPRAWIVQIVLTWTILLTTWLFTSPSQNINFVFSNVRFEHLHMGTTPYLIIVFVIVGLSVSGTHFFLKALHNRYW